MQPTAHYHAGLVVPDLAAAMDELSELLGTTFTEVLELPLGERTVKIAFSREGPPFLELIEGQPGSPWACEDGPRVHHLGWWAGDHDAERARLAALGLEPEMAGASLGLPCDYYVAPHSGVRIELVSGAVREALAARWGLPA